jgi:hypothetical protein
VSLAGATERDMRLYRIESAVTMNFKDKVAEWRARDIEQPPGNMVGEATPFESSPSTEFVSKFIEKKGCLGAKMDEAHPRQVVYGTQGSYEEKIKQLLREKDDLRLHCTDELLQVKYEHHLELEALQLSFKNQLSLKREENNDLRSKLVAYRLTLHELMGVSDEFQLLACSLMSDLQKVRCFSQSEAAGDTRTTTIASSLSVRGTMASVESMLLFDNGDNLSEVSSHPQSQDSSDPSFDPDTLIESEDEVGGPERETGSLTVAPSMQETAKYFDTHGVYEFRTYFLDMAEGGFFENEFMEKLMPLLYFSNGFQLLDTIVQDIIDQWEVLKTGRRISFDNMMDFFSGISLYPPAFDQEKFDRFLDCESEDLVDRVGIIREYPPICFGNDLVGTCFHWRNNIDLFWAISAEHYLNWNTSISREVRGLVRVSSAKE